MKKRYVLIICLLMVFTSLSAYVSDGYNDLLESSGYIESYESRKQIVPLVSEETWGSLRGQVSELFQFSTNSYLQLKYRKRGSREEYYLSHEKKFAFPLVAHSNWVFFKEKGLISESRIYLLDNEETYISLKPGRFDNRSALGVMIWGHSLYENIVLPVPYNKLLAMSLSDILIACKKQILWENLISRYSSYDYDTVRDLVDNIRGHLSELTYLDDGAISKEGQPVFIETEAFQPDHSYGVNCSGFVKWVVDGLLMGAGREALNISDMKRKRSDRGTKLSENHEERDPYFGLDWNRNIGNAYNSSFPGADVSDITCLSHFPCVDDIGFPMKDMSAVLYLLSIAYPGDFYLASVNVPFRPKGSDLTIRQHVHTGVLFPYFRQDGSYSLVVMENGEETSLNTFVSRYPQAHVSLIRMPSRPGFLPHGNRP